MGVSPCEFESRPGHKTVESYLGGFFIAQNEARSACCASADLSMVGCCLLAQILVLAVRLCLKINFCHIAHQPQQSSIATTSLRSALGFCRRSSLSYSANGIVCCASADLSAVGCCLLAQILALYLNQYILNPFENSDRLFNFVLAVIVWSAN